MTRKEKHFIKLFLMMLLAVLLCCLPVTASAKTVAKIGNKKYSSLEQAVKKVKKGQTIKLQSNVALSRFESINLNRNTTYTIDFNKKKVSGGLGITVSKGKVTFKNGNVTNVITVKKGSSLTIKSGTYQNLRNYGTTTITNGKLTNSKGIYGDVIENYNKLTIKKATIVCYSGFCLENSSKGTMIIRGGTYRNAKNKGSNIFQNLGKATVSGGTFTGSDKGIPLNNLGTITISGGKFINPVGAPNAYDPSQAYKHISNSGTMTIKGGTITAKKSSIAILSTGTLKISGGRIESYAAKPKPFRESSWNGAVAAYRGSLTITGGTIYSENGRGVEVSSGVTYSRTGGEIEAPYPGEEVA